MYIVIYCIHSLLNVQQINDINVYINNDNNNNKYRFGYINNNNNK
jgi:hypothetical protein